MAKVSMKQENVVPPVEKKEVEVTVEDSVPQENIDIEPEALSAEDLEDLEDLENSYVDEEEPVDIESLPPDTELWENGPTAGQVVAWKAEYGDVFITNVTYDKHVVWRTLRRPEYKQLVRQIEQLLTSEKMTQTEANMYNEELTCTICTLFPKYAMADFDKEMAGLPSILSQQIMESSGFATIDVRQL